MIESNLFKEFFNSEKSGGIILLICTVFSLIIANSAYGANYQHLWHLDVAGHSLGHWINDGLMTIFFLLIGLELEREIYIGELSKLKDALLPAFAAIGGIVVPAVIFMLFNYGTPTQPGAGIPMATDIAFAIGVLSLLGNRVPLALKVFLTALAVIDDLGAILVIALFYTKTIVWSNLGISMAIFVVLLFCNRTKVTALWIYLLLGLAMWYFMLNSGVHATITGVLLAFAIPFGNGDEKSVSYILQHRLHIPVAFVIMPIFALSNTAISVTGSLGSLFAESYAIGITLGLLLGKPLGIMTTTYIAVKLGICDLPKAMDWKSVLGVGLLAGIGFTMSIFITILAFDDPVIINNAKLIIVFTSAIAGILGYIWLKSTLKNVSSVL